MKTALALLCSLLIVSPCLAQRSPQPTTKTDTVTEYRLGTLESVTAELQRCTQDVKDRLVKIETTLDAIHEQLNKDSSFNVDEILKYILLAIITGGGGLALGKGKIIPKKGETKEE